MAHTALPTSQNGCICCTVRGDLVETLKKLSTKVAKFDGVIIETTGLADPAPVAQTFFVDKDIEKLYVLDCIVAVCDAKHLVMRLDDEKPEGVENEAVEQLAFADRVLLNKVDLVPEEEELAKIEARIRTINPEAPIMRCTNSRVDWKSVIGVGGFDLDRVLNFEPEFLTDLDAEHQHDATVSSVSVKFEGELMVRALHQWIGDLITFKGADLFRYKGVLAVKGSETKFVFQGVGMLFTGGDSDFKWGADEPRECRFVFIGRNLNRQELIDGVMGCKVCGELRFKVGDAVMARIDEGYAPGVVIDLWEEGNPYIIELEDGMQVGAGVFCIFCQIVKCILSKIQYAPPPPAGLRPNGRRLVRQGARQLDRRRAEHAGGACEGGAGDRRQAERTAALGDADERRGAGAGTDRRRDHRLVRKLGRPDGAAHRRALGQRRGVQDAARKRRRAESAEYAFWCDAAAHGCGEQ